MAGVIKVLLLTRYGGPQVAQLDALEARVPQGHAQLTEALLEITTPLCGLIWEQELSNHPDQQFASYVTNGITKGFRIGFDDTKGLRSCASNIRSATDHPEVVSDYLNREKALNSMVVVSPQDLPYIHCHISETWTLAVESGSVVTGKR